MQARFDPDLASPIPARNLLSQFEAAEHPTVPGALRDVAAQQAAATPFTGITAVEQFYSARTTPGTVFGFGSAFRPATAVDRVQQSATGPKAAAMDPLSTGADSIVATLFDGSARGAGYYLWPALLKKQSPSSAPLPGQQAGRHPMRVIC
jgi:hypothetical protein